MLCAMNYHRMGNATGVNTNGTLHSYARCEGIRTIRLESSGRMERDRSGAKTEPPVTRRRGERSEGEPKRSRDSPSGGRIEKVKYRSSRKGPSRNQMCRLRSTRLEEAYGPWKTSPVWPKSHSRCRSRRPVAAVGLCQSEKQSVLWPAQTLGTPTVPRTPITRRLR